MKLLRLLCLIIPAITLLCTTALCLPDSGFFLPDSVKEMTLRYRSIKNLIILPVVINRIPVNLILDTGCRNLVLFGKKFEKLLDLNPGSKVKFSGLGSGAPLTGSLSINNRITIEQVLGERIPVVVVPDRKLFTEHRGIDGVIGYDIFFKFEIEINTREGLITFRAAEHSSPPYAFSRVPLRIVETRPVMDSNVLIRSENKTDYEIMIDTGSTLGLLVKTADLENFKNRNFTQTIGYGFNGPVRGYQTISEHLLLEGLTMTDVPTGVIECAGANYASIGMEVLKDYIVVINYLKMYVCFKKWND
jgi:hypothetical protein